MAKNIVVVDDNQLAAEGIVSRIDWDSLGAQVVACLGDGQSVLDFLEANPVDLILSDINMPGISGLEMARIAQQRKITAKIILISAYDDFSYAKEAVRIGAFDYVEKPIDYEYLSQVIRRSLERIDQEARQREILKRSRPALTDRFFQDLIHTPPEDSRYFLADTVEYLGVPTDYARYICVLVRAANDMEVRALAGIERFHMMMMELRQSLEELFADFPFRYFLEQRSAHTLLLGADTQPSLFIRQVGDRLSSLCDQYEAGPLRIHVGIGRAQSSLWRLQLSHSDAEQALRYHYFLPQNNLFDIRDFAGRKDSPAPFRSQSEALIQLLAQKNLPGIRGHLESLSEEFAQSRPDKNTALLFAYDVAGGIHRFLYDLGLDSEAFQEQMQVFFSRAPGYANMSELCRGVYSLCEAVCACLEASSESYHRQLNKTILDHIREHYGDAELGLSSIALSVNVSPAHLSALFKKMNGKNLTEAITDIRMEYAEQLLRNSGLSIKEISERVGYSNQYYFSACFKKKTGVTPSTCRGNAAVEA